MSAWRRGLDAVFRHPATCMVATLCGLWAFLYFPLLAGYRVLPWDAIDQFYPTVWFNAHSLRAGLAPWWNPFIYGGYPQIADPQGMLFSPLLMGWMLLRADPGATWFTWGVLLHLLMGAGAMVPLLRRLGADVFGSLMAAIVYLGGGVAASRLEHVPMVLAYGYAPLVLLCATAFIRSSRLRWAVALGLAGGAMLTHLVQVTWLLALMCAAYIVVNVVARWGGMDGTARRRLVLGLGFALAIAVAMALPQLALTLAFSIVSNRQDLPLAAAGDASLTVRSFLSLVAPNAQHALRGNYTGPASRVETLFYIGALPAMLILVRMRGAWHDPSRRRTLAFFAIVAILSILYALGVNTPFYGWLYGWLPGMHHFRRPSDAAYLVNLSLAVGAGLAAASLDLRNRGATGALLLAAAGWLALSSAGMRDPTTRWDGVSALPAIVAIGLWCWLRSKPRKEEAVALCLLVLAAVDYRGFNLNGSLTGSRDNRATFARDPIAKALVDHLRRNAGFLPSRVVTEGIGPGWDNLPMVAGVATAQSYNPLRYRLYDEWYGARENGALPLPTTPFHPFTGSALDRLLGTRYVVRKGGLPVLPDAYARIASDKDREVWYSADVYPRLLSPVDIRWQAPVPGNFEATDFRDVAYLDPSAHSARVASSRASRVAAAIERSSHTRIEIHAEAPAGAGWVVLNEVDCPGWRATVDGSDTPIVRANGMFRAVAVPKGNHRIVFSFDPMSFIAVGWRQWLAQNGDHAPPM